jgi:hypothetical protein
MALTNCPECNKEISTTAEACPHCGFKLRNNQPSPKPTQSKKTSGIAMGCAIVLGIVVLIAIIGTIASSNSRKNTSSLPTASSQAQQLSSKSIFSSSEISAAQQYLASMGWTEERIEKITPTVLNVASKIYQDDKVTPRPSNVQILKRACRVIDKLMNIPEGNYNIEAVIDATP